MSDVAQGPGWWLASDGRWYPPETHPSVRAPTTPPVPGQASFPVRPPVPFQSPPQQATARREGTSPPGAAGHRTSGSPWGLPGQREIEGAPDEQRQLGGSRRSQRFRRAADPRGAFVAVLSLVLLGACFVPYYTLTPGLGDSVRQTTTVIDHAFGGWRLVIPAVSALTALIGIVNWVLKVGQRGALSVFVVLRIAVLLQLGVWVLPIFFHRYAGPVVGAGAPVVSVGWVAYSAATVAFVAVAGSSASLGRSAKP